MNDYSTFIYKSRYAKWRDDLGRRENWDETVDRYINFWESRIAGGNLGNAQEKKLLHVLRTEIRPAILNMDVMPSMRAFMTAGKALEIDNIAGYNCSFVAIDHPRCFDEIMYILMCGTGVGFTVERADVNKLPTVSEEFHDTETTIQVSDSRIGWASAFREFISMLYSGRVPRWDVSRVRPAGAPLKTFGGRASGPEPLEDLFRYATDLFRRAAGRKLNSLECHDLVCKIAEIVVVGGVRRSALISLSNLTDERMRNAKNGQWWEHNGERALANNSVAYTEKPDLQIFLKEWSTLYESKSGERGIFNRVAATKQRRAALQLRDNADSEEYSYGTNPCAEIILRPNGLCNLSEVVVRVDDTIEELQRKVRLASILGTLQSTLTKFRYLRRVWRSNAESERLLGVSLTGIMDHPILSDPSWNEHRNGKTNRPLDKNYGPNGMTVPALLNELKGVAIATNREFAAELGISESNAVTCVKPSGTVSQLVGCSSGIHPAFSEYYVRTVRQDVKDPLTKFLIDSGVPHETDVTNSSNVVFSFPMKAPGNAVKQTAVDQMKMYEIYKEHWCEHNPSITIYYTDDEFLGIGDWVYRNWDNVIGVSLLPKSDHVYRQAPYQAITEEEFKCLEHDMPIIDWDRLVEYESEDFTTASHELACVSGVCEI